MAQHAVEPNVTVKKLASMLPQLISSGALLLVLGLTAFLRYMTDYFACTLQSILKT